MKILQTSDTHIGITTEGQLKQMFRKVAKEEFDVLVHCGDYCGTELGWKCVERTIKLMRSFIPDKPIITTIGNHDYWCKSNKRVKQTNSLGRTVWTKRHPDAADFMTNMDNIRRVFKEYNIIFLDDHGAWSLPEDPRVVFAGVSGWYRDPNHPTTDGHRLPLFLEGDTDRYLLKKCNDRVFELADKDLATFEKDWQTLVFVSHFPVINTGNDYKGAFEKFSWDEHIGTYLQETFDCKFFLNGHAHQLHLGPLRFESGPDYYKPAYHLFEV